MSTVRSMPRIEIEEKASMGWKQKNLGFIIDENQMNVALTRAKRGLIIVGKEMWGMQFCSCICNNAKLFRAVWHCA